MNPMYISI